MNIECGCEDNFCDCYQKDKRPDVSESTLTVGSIAPVVTERMLTMAMREAVKVGLIHKYTNTDEYTINWDRMKKVLSAAIKQ